MAQYLFKELKPMEIVLLEILNLADTRKSNFSKFDFCRKYNITSRTLQDYIRNLKRLGFITTKASKIYVEYYITEDGIATLLSRDVYLSKLEINKHKGL